MGPLRESRGARGAPNPSPYRPIIRARPLAPREKPGLGGLPLSARYSLLTPVWALPCLACFQVRDMDFFAERAMRSRAHQTIKALPVYFIELFFPLLLLSSGVSLDPREVTNGDYMKFTQATGHPVPEHWVDGRYPEGRESEPVVLITWYDASRYCRWAGRKRLPTVDEWLAVCEAGKLGKEGDVWEWTSTEMPTEEGAFKALCGPMDTCDCSHRYLPEWKNIVKGFRCMGGSLQVASTGNPRRGLP